MANLKKKTAKKDVRDNSQMINPDILLRDNMPHTDEVHNNDVMRINSFLDTCYLNSGYNSQYTDEGLYY